MTRILIVDDKPENLYFLRALLQGHGCDVEEARHGAEALVKARQLPPQLVISDLLMPVMDGYSLLRTWKMDSRLKGIPFVVYTATYTEPQDEKLALDLGADAFILKPSEPEPFMARVNELLARQRRDELASVHEPVAEVESLLKEYSEVLIRKLEEKSIQLEQSNRDLLEDIARREVAEAQARQSLAEAERARSALLSILEDQRRIETELREQEHRLSESQRIGHIGSWYVDAAGNMIWSDETYRIYGQSRDTFTPSATSYIPLIHPEDRADMQARLAACLEGQPIGDVDFRVVLPDGHIRYLHGRGELHLDDQQRVSYLTGTVQDITERKLAEMWLAESERRFATLFLATPVGTCITRQKDGVFLDVNEAFATITGFSREELLGHSSLDFNFWLDPEDRRRIVDALVRDGRVRNWEVGFRRKDGSLGYSMRSLEHLKLDGEECILTALNDITERRRIDEELAASRERLKALSRQLIEAQESERRHLARELHDEIGQALTAIKLNLNCLNQPALPPASASLVHDAVDIVDQTLQQVRGLALDLRPSMLDDIGLVATLRWYFDRQSQRVGFTPHFVADPSIDGTSPEVNTACFRVAQESLTNIARYAQASCVCLELYQRDGELELVVQDDGLGFDVAAARDRATRGGSIGLLGMQERVQLVGGRFEIESVLEQGTTIRAWFPLTGDRPPEPCEVVPRSHG